MFSAKWELYSLILCGWIFASNGENWPTVKILSPRKNREVETIYRRLMYELCESQEPDELCFFYS